MYEIYIYIIISIVFECGGGMLYGVAVGFDPRLVFISTLLINILTVLVAAQLVDRFLCWRKGIKEWIERRTSRGQRFIHRYAHFGIIIGAFLFSPLQVTVIGRLLGIQPSKFYPPLIGGIVLGATISMGLALGIFKLILGW